MLAEVSARSATATWRTGNCACGSANAATNSANTRLFNAKEIRDEPRFARAQYQRTGSMSSNVKKMGRSNVTMPSLWESPLLVAHRNRYVLVFALQRD